MLSFQHCNSQIACQNSQQGRTSSDCFFHVCLGLFERQPVFKILEQLPYSGHLSEQELYRALLGHTGTLLHTLRMWTGTRTMAIRQKLRSDRRLKLLDGFIHFVGCLKDRWIDFSISHRWHELCLRYEVAVKGSPLCCKSGHHYLQLHA